jgi:hypothetical protein
MVSYLPTGSKFDPEWAVHGMMRRRAVPEQPTLSSEANGKRQFQSQKVAFFSSRLACKRRTLQLGLGTTAGKIDPRLREKLGRRVWTRWGAPPRSIARPRSERLSNVARHQRKGGVRPIREPSVRPREGFSPNPSRLTEL